MPLFSVIVPIYNVESYLRECLESILNQTFKDFELILIDDGSQDHSAEIADEYKRDSRVVVIHQKNAGLSEARNRGMDESEGEYLVFIDSDDYIEYDSLAKFSSIILQYNFPDIIAAQAYTLFSDGRVEPKIKNRFHIEGVKQGRVFLETGYKENAIVACSQFNIYRRAMIREKRIKFMKGILHEDELWTPTVMYTADSVIDAGFIFYYHRQRSGSITHSLNKRKNAFDLFIVCDKLVNLSNTYNRKETPWLRDRISMLYMNATYIGGNEILKEIEINRMIPIRNAKRLRNVIKGLVFLISPKLYIRLDKLIKQR